MGVFCYTQGMPRAAITVNMPTVLYTGRAMYSAVTKTNVLRKNVTQVLGLNLDFYYLEMKRNC